MSLPKPNLDKTFDQLVEEARKSIPGYSPEWTDYNPSDPGITHIDLLAWLSEIALYRINLITDKHRLKYLQLLGVKPQPTKQAKVDLTFIYDKKKTLCKKTLCKGTQVSTEIVSKPIYFQLDEDINIVPGTLEKIVVDESASGIYDRSSSNKEGDLFFAPFGEDIQKGCALCLGFNFENNSSDTKNLKERPELCDCSFNLNNNPPDTLNFMCYLYENDLVEPGKHGTEKDSKFENANLKWEISVKSSGKSSDENGWKTILLEDIEDKTEGFKKSGRIVFKKLEDWTSRCLFPELITLSKPYFWLRCKVEESHYEYPPRIEMLRLNTVSATHSRMVREDNEKRVSNGLPGQVFKLSETPILDKTLKLAIWEWTEVQDFRNSGPYDKHFVLNRVTGKIRFGDGKKGLIPSVGSTIIMLKYASDDVEKRKPIEYKEWISNGSPVQIFELKDPPTLEMKFKLSIDEDKWVEVHNFGKSDPYDKHFVLNRNRGEIIFGNGKNGLVPPAGSAIMILICASDDREKGQLREYKEWVSNGLQNQTFKLKETLISEMEFKLLVEEKWTEVDDFEGSGPSDKHFVLDNEIGEFKFGDGLTGSVPSAGSDVEILEYVSGGGEEGNLMAECNWNTEDYNGKIMNCRPSTGGKRAQTIEEAIDDFLRDLKIPYTAVTLNDFEQIAINTPGLRVARAKAIPNYNPTDPEPKNPEKNRGSVTVVVVPYTPLEFLKTVPEMSEGFKRAVCLHLDKHRLIGTDIHVISPTYVKVVISVTVVPMDSFRDDSLIQKKIIEKLNFFLHPITGGLEEKGWPIGRDVYLSEIYSIIENIKIENIKGVNYVARLSISGFKEVPTDPDGDSMPKSCYKEVSTDTYGNLMLNSVAGVVYSGVHKVNITRGANLHHNRG